MPAPAGSTPTVVVRRVSTERCTLAIYITWGSEAGAVNHLSLVQCVLDATPLIRARSGISRGMPVHMTYRRRRERAEYPYRQGTAVLRRRLATASPPKSESEARRRRTTSPRATVSSTTGHGIDRRAYGASGCHGDQVRRETSGRLQVSRAGTKARLKWATPRCQRRHLTPSRR